jgi:4-hydroxy-tetrahydrodipicolinate synthase
MKTTGTLKTDWQGNFVATVTPFHENGDIDEGRFIANLQLLMEEGADGFVIAGCTGESWALKDDERVRLFELAVTHTQSRVPVIASVSKIVTSEVVKLARAAAETGVAGVLALPPYFALPGRREIVSHFEAISEGSELPIMIYNNPRRTAINLTPNILDEMADIKHVVAVKESSSDFVQTEKTIHVLGDRIAVFTGHSAERGAAAVLMGVVGFVSSLEGQIMGRRALDLWNAAASGDFLQARIIQRETLQLQTAVSSCGGTSPADVKAAMNLLGRPGGFPRRPILPLTAAQERDLADHLEELGFLTGRGQHASATN